MNKNDRARLRRFIETIKEYEEKRNTELCDSLDEITNKDKDREEKDDED